MTHKFSIRSFVTLVIFACCLVFNSLEAHAAWRAVGDVKAVERTSTAANITLTGGGRLSVSFVTPDVARIRLNPRGAFEPDASYAVEDKRRAGVPVNVSETSDAIEISSGAGTQPAMRVRVRRAGALITIFDAQGRVVCEDDPARPVMYDPDTGAIETTKRRVPTELYYGFGEKALPISRHERRMVMWNYDTFAYPPGLDPIYQSIPFFTSLRREGGQSHTYGVFLDNTYRTYFDMGHTDQARYTFGAAGGELNYYVFTGAAERTPKNILRDYTDLTGRAARARRCALLRYRLHGRLSGFYVGQKSFPTTRTDARRSARARLPHRHHH